MTAWWRRFIPSKNDREIRRLSTRLAEINAFEEQLKELSDTQLREQTTLLQARFAQNFAKLGGNVGQVHFFGNKEDNKTERQRLDAALAPLLPEAFATVREASVRVLGLRHYDVQMLGGMALHEGKVAEMKTGEGKTLVGTLPVYLNALTGRGVHVITVNEYLATRDAAWMGKLYQFLGLEVGVIVSGMPDSQRQSAYNAPITYGTNSEFGFDYLRDNMKLFLHDYVQRGLHFAIVDEVDSILIDEARTPLIISGPAEESTDKYIRINELIPGLRREQDYTVDEKSRSVVLTEQGVHTIEKRLQIDNLYEPDNIEILHHLNQALRAHTLYRRDVDYIVDNNKVKIIDEFTGRVLEGRRWSDGLHQAVEAKEMVRIENENQTLATITYQNYFRHFIKLAGMTGTAETEAEEFAKIYDLDVVAIPTNKNMLREDLDDVVYKTEREKFAAIVETIKECVEKGQPVLVGTISVEKSEVLSRLLKKLQVPHHVLNAKYHLQEAEIIAQAGRLGAVTIATNMAGRGTDILLGGNPEALAQATARQQENISPEAYLQLLEQCKEQCAQEKAQVIAAGGLFILGTERHESRRIDNQLRGRAGRQGDPGSSLFYISLEDDLMRIFGGERIMHLMERFGMQEGEVIQHPWVNKSIENAQRRVEGHNFDTRKHLLEYDDVMNDQRGAIYKLRRQVIGADIATTKEMVLDLLEEVIINLVERTCPPRVHPQEWQLNTLQETMHEYFGTTIDVANIANMEREGIENELYSIAEQSIQKREERFGVDAYYHVSRIIYLQTIDSLWKDHLRDMDHLREGISLRGYAQKDPKQEYKKEGFALFANTMATITANVVQKISHVVITAETEQTYQARLEAEKIKQAKVLQQGSPEEVPNKLETIRRPATKVGVNDPCPCGSGKKYKKCHMSKDAVQV